LELIRKEVSIRILELSTRRQIHLIRESFLRPLESIFGTLLIALLLFTVSISRLKTYFLGFACFTSGFAINA
jgi:hypothetical protein